MPVARFFIAEKAVGAKGFKAIWTEIKDPMDCSKGFQCFTSKYCISEALKCNSIDNCGKNDRSDEVDCKQAGLLGRLWAQILTKLGIV